MIGVFDSGVGGLSVVEAIHARLPSADIVYFGDTEQAPYGEKSSREIATLIAMALRRLSAAGATDIVSACNSASVSVHSVPMDLLRIGMFNIVEMVLPTVEALAPKQINEGKKIALLGTSATVRSRIYQDAFRERGISIEAIAVPHLAGLIEEGASPKHLLPILRAAVAKATASGADIVSLSCTHYPFVRGHIEACLRDAGSAAVVFDPADAVAAEVERRFSSAHDAEGHIRFLFSKESAVFSSYVERLFGGVSYTLEPAGPIYWALKTF